MAFYFYFPPPPRVFFGLARHFDVCSNVFFPAAANELEGSRTLHCPVPKAAKTESWQAPASFLVNPTPDRRGARVLPLSGGTIRRKKIRPPRWWVRIGGGVLLLGVWPIAQRDASFVRFSFARRTNQVRVFPSSLVGGSGGGSSQGRSGGFPCTAVIPGHLHQENSSEKRQPFSSELYA